MNIELIIGSLGALCILVSFVLLQFHYVTDEDVRYDAANAFGSLCLVYYAWSGGVWPFVVLNTVWGLVSLRDVVLYYSKPRG